MVAQRMCLGNLMSQFSMLIFYCIQAPCTALQGVVSAANLFWDGGFGVLCHVNKLVRANQNIFNKQHFMPLYFVYLAFSCNDEGGHMFTPLFLYL